MIVTNGNRAFRKPVKWAGDRPDLRVASYPVMLRAVARQLARKGCWLALPIEIVAMDWDGHPGDNLARLNDIMAHSDLLTDAQVSRLKAALKELQERVIQS